MDEMRAVAAGTGPMTPQAARPSSASASAALTGAIA
jgi:hypothetical protein